MKKLSKNPCVFMSCLKINYGQSAVLIAVCVNFTASLRGAVKAENIPIEPDLDNASEGKMTR